MFVVRHVIKWIVQMYINEEHKIYLNEKMFILERWGGGKRKDRGMCCWKEKGMGGGSTKKTKITKNHKKKRKEKRKKEEKSFPECFLPRLTILLPNFIRSKRAHRKSRLERLSRFRNIMR